MMDRRGFLGGALASAGMLTLAVQFGCGDRMGPRIRHADASGELTANAYITILPDGRVQLMVHKTEIGQGVTTGYAHGELADRLNLAIAALREEAEAENRERYGGQLQ